MTRASSTLTVVQELYSLQSDVASILNADSDLQIDLVRARQVAREFNVLLTLVREKRGWLYMGGHDVLEEMETLDRQLAKTVSSRS